MPDAVEVAQEDFITQDEIDYALGREAAMSMELSAFMSISWKDMTRGNSCLSENEYGIGGGSGGFQATMFYNEHDGKGIRLEKGVWKSVCKSALNRNVVEKGYAERSTRINIYLHRGKKTTRHTRKNRQKARQRASVWSMDSDLNVRSTQS